MAQTADLPVTFGSFIISLASSAMLHLGEIADPSTGARAVNLPLAKHTIDLIAVLKDKTEGNLDGEERQLVDTLLSDLQVKYVAAAK